MNLISACSALFAIDMIVTLGISSSISSYKATEILRQLQKAGHTVRVAMTRNATRFIRPILFQSLSQNPVYLDEFKARHGEVLHVELARESKLVVVAPASANLIGKFANGIADDFLTTFFLARRCPALIAPAMNVYMYRNPAVQKNIETLRATGVQFVEPGEGYLACGDEGAGRLAEVEEIVAKALSMLQTAESLAGKRVIVTAGPTWERIDPVRLLTNRSSGKMGFAMAQEAVARGAEVTLISGPTQVLPPLGVELIRVESAEEMKNAVLANFDTADFLIKAAAVSDFRAAQPLTRKRKKIEGPDTLTLDRTDDILQTVAQRKENQIIVGFCAETENLEVNAQSKLQRKNLDFIVANLLTETNNPFQSEENEVLVLDSLGYKTHFVLQKKVQLAVKIWDLILERATEIRSSTSVAAPR